MQGFLGGVIKDFKNLASQQNLDVNLINIHCNRARQELENHLLA